MREKEKISDSYDERKYSLQNIFMLITEFSLGEVNEDVEGDCEKLQVVYYFTVTFA